MLCFCDYRAVFSVNWDSNEFIDTVFPWSGRTHCTQLAVGTDAPTCRGTVEIILCSCNQIVLVIDVQS